MGESIRIGQGCTDFSDCINPVMMSKALLKCVRCQGCRTEAVRSILGLSATTTVSRTARTGPIGLAQSQREFSQLTSRGENEEAHNDSVNSAESETQELEPSSAQTTPQSIPESHVPWYLQDEMQEILPQSPKRRQLLPALPDNPPPILDGCLHNLSDTLGVDDLALFDLRDIDPPSALGANLIMIIGTVRSFKHLNSASDRFCRWLRREHKLRPDADGLLGRQELKLKLRRKARKAKLASTVGAEITDLDDGIVTRWICINVGSIADGRPASAIPRAPGFVGFGTQSPTCQLVVQLMTEDKRAELDLETLWGGLLRHRQPMPIIEREAIESVDPTELERSKTLSRVTYMNHQKRELHTTLARRSELASGNCIAESSLLLKQAPLPVFTLPYGKEGVWKKWNEPSTVPPYQYGPLQTISSMPKEELIEALGQGPTDRSSTEILRQYHACISKHEFPYKEALRFELVRLAVEIGHPNYTKEDLYRAFLNLSLSEFNISLTHMTKIIDTFLLYRPPTQIDPQNPSDLRLSEEDLNYALKVISHMALRGRQPFDTNILSRLHRAAMFQVPVYIKPKSIAPGTTYTENAYPVSEEVYRVANTAQRRIRKVMRLGFTLFSAKEFPMLLQLHLNQAEYNLFWDVWRRSTILGIRRTREVYLLVFEMMAARANEKMIMEMIWNIVPMMEREFVPVELDKDLAKALMACLLVVEPKLRTTLDDSGISHVKGPIFELWNKCIRTMLREMEIST